VREREREGSQYLATDDYIVVDLLVLAGELVRGDDDHQLDNLVGLLAPNGDRHWPAEVAALPIDHLQKRDPFT
jgi:hypothetical protein